MSLYFLDLCYRKASCLFLAVAAVIVQSATVLQAAPVSGQAPTDALTFKVYVEPAELDPFSPLNKFTAERSDNAPVEVRRGTLVRLIIIGTLKEGWHTYPITQRSSDPASENVPTRLSYKEAAGLKPLWPLWESEPEWVVEEGVGVFLEYTRHFSWSQDILVLPDARPGSVELPLEIGLSLCEKSNCWPMKYQFNPPIKIGSEQAAPLTMELQSRLTTKEPAIQIVEVPPHLRKYLIGRSEASAARGAAITAESPAAYKSGMEKIGEQLTEQVRTPVSLSLFLLTGVFWGAVSLVTPCVFPMIPITVSFFLKQSEKEHHRPVTMATVYCLTIVIVLTIAAVLLLSVFRELSVNPIMNFVLGGILIFFALSLFGMYDIELPSGLARFTSAREGKGGFVGTIFMALTFTIVSFACVAPFLGGFTGTAGTIRLTLIERVLGGLAFSATFAAPFFVLALFPSLLKKLPKSGSWLNSVKVVMGFLELAAALKFLRLGELVYIGQAAFFTYDVVLGMWIGISLLCGLYLLNVFRLPHDSPQEYLSVPRLLFSLVFLSLGFYLVPALFKSADGEKQRPAGVVYSWIDSFLLPEPSEGKSSLAWSGNLEHAIEEARAERRKTRERKLVFIDFTGESCVNCRWNENNVFNKAVVKELFQPYKLVQLYTDIVPNNFYATRLGDSSPGIARRKADGEANLWFQRRYFGTEQLPLYVILEPLLDGKIDVVGVYSEGKINNESAFVSFLKEPLMPHRRNLRAEASGR